MQFGRKIAKKRQSPHLSANGEFVLMLYAGGVSMFSFPGPGNNQ